MIDPQSPNITTTLIPRAAAKAAMRSRRAWSLALLGVVLISGCRAGAFALPLPKSTAEVNNVAHKTDNDAPQPLAAADELTTLADLVSESAKVENVNDSRVGGSNVVQPAGVYGNFPPVQQVRANDVRNEAAVPIVQPVGYQEHELPAPAPNYSSPNKTIGDYYSEPIDRSGTEFGNGDPSGVFDETRPQPFSFHGSMLPQHRPKTATQRALELLNENQQLMSDNARLSAKVEILTQQLEGAHKEIGRLHDQRAQLEHQLREAGKENEQWRQKLAEVGQYFQESRSEQTRRIQSLTQTIDQLQRLIEAQEAAASPAVPTAKTTGVKNGPPIVEAVESDADQNFPPIVVPADTATAEPPAATLGDQFELVAPRDDQTPENQ